MRRRGEYVEPSFAHMYDTGGLRRTHLRGHQNILKRLLVHAGAFNLGLLMRKAFGRGTPRGLQGRRFGVGPLEIAFGIFVATFVPIQSAVVWIARAMLSGARASPLASCPEPTVRVPSASPALNATLDWKV